MSVLNLSATRGRRVLVALVAATATSASLLTAAGPGTAQARPAQTSPRGAAGPAVPVIDWTGCGQGAPEALRCARVRVPLDYDAPDGPTIMLGLAKLPARQPSARIGSLFVNPGGPGGPARGFVQPAARLLGPAARNRFDVIGIDPRGVGTSTPAKCVLVDPPELSFYFPFTPSEVAKQLRWGAALREGCAERSNAILDHMTTADTARDMDLIRQAVGDPQLTYYGISYGSYLGATYAALFPDKVRALIVDGVLDPLAWSTGRAGESHLPFSTRIKSGLGAMETLRAALTECDRVGKPRCAFAPNAQAKWNRFDARLRRGPVRFHGGGRLRFSDLYGGVLGALYDRSAYQSLFQELDGIYRDIFGRPAVRTGATSAVGLKRLAERVQADRPAGPWAAPTAARARRTYFAGFEGVACSDSANPSNPRAWVRAARFDDERGARGFGRLWTWVSSPCAGWPGSSADAYRGPWELDTSTPVLVVGNSHDPATPITGAIALHELFGNSRLVTLNTWGHGALGQSACVTRLFDAYLETQAVPATNVRCRADKPLFPRR